MLAPTSNVLDGLTVPHYSKDPSTEVKGSMPERSCETLREYSRVDKSTLIISQTLAQFSKGFAQFVLFRLVLDHRFVQSFHYQLVGFLVAFDGRLE